MTTDDSHRKSLLTEITKHPNGMPIFSTQLLRQYEALGDAVRLEPYHGDSHPRYAVAPIYFVFLTDAIHIPAPVARTHARETG